MAKRLNKLPVRFCISTSGFGESQNTKSYRLSLVFVGFRRFSFSCSKARVQPKAHVLLRPRRTPHASLATRDAPRSPIRIQRIQRPAPPVTTGDHRWPSPTGHHQVTNFRAFTDIHFGCEVNQMNSANGFFYDFSAYFGISFKPD